MGNQLTKEGLAVRRKRYRKQYVHHEPAQALILANGMTTAARHHHRDGCMFEGNWDWTLYQSGRNMYKCAQPIGLVVVTQRKGPPACRWNKRLVCFCVCSCFPGGGWFAGLSQES